MGILDRDSADSRSARAGIHVCQVNIGIASLNTSSAPAAASWALIIEKDIKCLCIAKIDGLAEWNSAKSNSIGVVGHLVVVAIAAAGSDAVGGAVKAGP